MSRFTDRMTIDDLIQQRDGWKNDWSQAATRELKAQNERIEAQIERDAARKQAKALGDELADANHEVDVLRSLTDELHAVIDQANELLDDILLLEPQLKHALDENGDWDIERITRAAEYLRDQAAAQSLGYTDQQPDPAPPTPPRPRFVVIQGGAA